MRFLFAIALALGIAAAAYGAAATMTVNGGAIEGGADFNLTCTASANVDAWGLETDTDSVSNVRVIVDGDCAGNDLFVVVTNGGTPIADAKVTLASGNSGNMTLTALGFSNLTPAPQLVGNVTDIHIWIEGPFGDTP